MGTRMGGRVGRVGRALGLTFGVTILCLLVEISPLTSWWHTMLYHFNGPAGALFLPVLIDVAGLWAILTGLILVGRGGRLRGTIWSGIMLMLPWVSVKEGTIAAGYTEPHWMSLLLMSIVFAGVVAVNVFWRAGGRALVERLLPVCEVLLYSLSLTGVLVLGQLLYFFARSGGLNDVPKLHAAVAAGVRPAGEPKRVIVLLFDELSYEQTYGNRAANVALPAFDRLAAESTVFRDVRPAAEYTDRAIPSLLTGQTVENIRGSADGRRLEMLGAGDARTQAWTWFDEQNTVFADALKAGYGTGLAGWYNPYCRILPDVLERCEWRAQSIPPNRMGTVSAGRDLMEKSLAPAREVLGRIPGFFVPRLRSGGSDEELTERHVKDYEQLSQAADSLLSDPAMTFVFLHMPVPHQGGIYDRRTQRMTRHSSSYLDNLALADAYLGHARELLERRGDWDGSTVVVLGDHSWRTWMWGGSLFWTGEDEAVSAGKGFDDRPAMVVKLANRGMAAHVDAAFEAKRTRWLLDELMTGRIRTEAELARWVGEQAR